MLTALGLAGPAAAQDCDWIAPFVAGATPPDKAACDAGVCQWRFAYRDGRARDMFEAKGSELEACLGPAMEQGDQVNHPDSYELRQFQAEGRAVYLSIKDKAALQQTIVFLRIGPGT